MHRIFFVSGSISAFLAIAAGAFGAHFLKKHLEAEMLSIFETAVRYQMYHALALVLVAIVGNIKTGRWYSVAGWSFIAGTFLFSGSLYLLSLTGIKWLGIFTPFGGVAFLFGWFCMVMVALGNREQKTEDRL